MPPSAATTELPAAEQARLVVSYHSRRDRAQAFEKFGQLVQSDITQSEDRKKLLDAAPDIYGLVVFAGDPARPKNPVEWEAAARRSMDANYLGPILLARDAAARMQSRGTQGAIALFSTMQAPAP